MRSRRGWKPRLAVAPTASARPRPSRRLPPQWSLNSTWRSRWGKTSSRSTGISRTPQNGGVGIGTSVRAAERTESSVGRRAVVLVLAASRGSVLRLGADLLDQRARAPRRRPAGPSWRGPRTRPCSRRRRARRSRRTPCPSGRATRRPKLRLIAAPPISTGNSRPFSCSSWTRDRHLLRGRDEQRGQADGRRLVLDWRR